MQEREEQADRDRLDLGSRQTRDRLLQRARVERDEHPFRPHALAHREAELARDERRGLVRGEVVERGAVLAADLENVAEPLGGDERRTRAAPLQQGVRRHRRPVREHVHGIRRDAGRGERRGNATRLVTDDGGTLAVTSSPSTTATRSVNVPPTSTPTEIPPIAQSSRG